MRPTLIWRLPYLSSASHATGQRPATLTDWVRSARAAEAAGIDILLLPDDEGYPDPWTTAAALLHETRALKFMISLRPGAMLPAVAAHAAQSLQSLSGERMLLKVDDTTEPSDNSGDGALNADQQAERGTEFLAIFNALWRENGQLHHRGRYFQVEYGRLPDLSYTQTDHARGPLAKRPPVYVVAHASADASVSTRKNTQRGDGVIFSCDRPEELAQRIVTARIRTDVRVVCVFGTLALNAGDRSPVSAFVSTTRSAEQIAARMRAFVEHGAQALIFNGWSDSDDIHRFHEHVLAHLPARHDAL